MQLSRRAAWSGLAVTLAGTAGCTKPVYEIRYRLVLEFDDDGITRRGSAVRVLRLGATNSWSMSNSASWGGIHGPAAVVDLGNGRHIFGLISRTVKRDGFYYRTDLTPLAIEIQRSKDNGLAIQGADYDDSGRNPFYESMANDRNLSIELDKSEWPMLAVVLDPKDSGTATAVKLEDVGQIFPKISPVSARLEATSESISFNALEKTLPWTAAVPDRLRPGLSRESDVTVLQIEDFIRK